MEIRLDQLSKVFGTQHAVDKVSFTAKVGITGFLGPNGAGKSTTMRMITGYLQPTAGSITIDGMDVWPTSPAVRNLIGYLPEHNPLYGDMYVREYLHFIGGIHKLPNRSRRIAEVIELVGLQLESHKLINTLSKGYRQRVGLAQALLNDPPILILDEPTSGLDPNQLSEIREVIRQLGKTKIVLLSTHIMQEVQALCERVLIINRGRLVADDAIESLSGRLEGGAIVYLTCEKPPDEKALQQVPGVIRAKVSGKQASLQVAPAAEVRPAIAKLCTQADWGLLELRKEAASIEDAFQALTQQEALN